MLPSKVCSVTPDHGELALHGRPKERRVAALTDAATTTAGPMGVVAPTSTSMRSLLAGTYLSRFGALTLLMSYGKSVGHPFARSSQRYPRSMTKD